MTETVEPGRLELFERERPRLTGLAYVGAHRVQRLLSGGWRLFGLGSRPNSPDQLPPVRVASINSTPSIIVDAANGPVILSGEAILGRISSIWVRLNPDKAAALGGPPRVL